MLRSDVFSCFVFYAVLLILKMYALAILTGQLRLRKKVNRLLCNRFRNPKNINNRAKTKPMQQRWLYICELYSNSFGFQAFANPEDALRHGGLEFFREDPDVERCRRWGLSLSSDQRMTALPPSHPDPWSPAVPSRPLVWMGRIVLHITQNPIKFDSPAEGLF